MEFNMCVLMDFENIAAGAEKEGHGRFNTRAVMTRLKEKGRILFSRSYGDWGRFAKYKQDMLEQAVQAIELTSYRGQEKNRADIALAVDAMELAFRREYIDTFVLLSGDSDFTPLVLRLRELNKRVIGIGTRRSSSRLLVECCDEFIFYESIIRGRNTSKKASGDAVESMSKDEALAMMVQTIEGLQKDEPGAVLAGRVKQSLMRKAPTFDESEYGYSGFARFLEAARDKKLVLLSEDEKAGGYRVDLPSDGSQAAEEEEDRGDEGPLLEGEAERLRELLAAEGVDPLDALRRHTVVHEFVDHVTERTRRKKRNTLIYTVGDIARRTRHTDPQVRSRQVRTVLLGIFQAGLLMHADGQPIRKETAPFNVDCDGEELLRQLRGWYVERLLEKGESLADSKALSTLLWGDHDHVTQSEELVAWASHELNERRSGGPREEPREDAPKEAAQDDAKAPEEEAKEEEAPKKKRTRRRRTTKKKADDTTADETKADETKADETKADETKADETKADEEAPKPKRKRTTTRRRTTKKKTEEVKAEDSTDS